MSLPERELRSLVLLLDDEDPRSLALVRERILGLGDRVMPFLEEAHDVLGPRLRPRLDELMGELRFRSLAEALRRAATQPEPDLETASFLIARFGRPTLDPAPYRAWLDLAAEEVSRRAPATEPYLLLQHLIDYLFEEQGLKGDTQRFYDPANSFLDQVIDRKRGIPISLTTLLLLVARRLGLPLHGAGLPGHFMARFDGAKVPLFVDSFHGGRILTRLQCRQFLLRMGYSFQETFLSPATSREILARTLRNLIAVYQRSGAPGRAEQASTLVEILLTGGACDAGSEVE